LGYAAGQHPGPKIGGHLLTLTSVKTPPLTSVIFDTADFSSVLICSEQSVKRPIQFARFLLIKSQKIYLHIFIYLGYVFNYPVSFYRTMRMHSADYAVARVCPSACHTPVLCRNG